MKYEMLLIFYEFSLNPNNYNRLRLKWANKSLTYFDKKNRNFHFGF